MASGSSSKPPEKTGGEPGRHRPGPWPPKIEPFVSNTDHNPRELKSWAKRTGFNFSGEAEASGRSGAGVADAEKRRNGSSPKIEIDPMLGKSKGRSEGEGEIGPAAVNGNVVDGSGKRDGAGGNGVHEGKAAVVVAPLPEAKDPTKGERDVEIDMFPSEPEPGNLLQRRYSGTRLKYSLQEKPGPVPLLLYGIQHYLSLAGSLIFIPLIIVPAMGGSDEETATVISTMLLVSGITTILQLYFGTRLPLVQGSSFVYLAPALVIINSEDFRNLSENKFKHIMKELQGAIIVGSVFQTIFGFSGLMSVLLRFINPVVVAPTVAAMGLAFFSYGFPLAGSCVEISIPQIVLLFLFAMYLRGVNVYGHRVFQIFAVPLSIVIVWMYAFFLTQGGAYNFKGCSANIPPSNILTDACRRHSFTMKHCRTDASSAWKAASWVRVPYPFQWGIPTFHLRTSIIMLAVSLVASVDSVGSYHSASLLANIPPPTPGIVSRGIGLEGFSSILAALWGTGTGSTTLVESVHTIDSTKIASRRIIAAGAVCLIIFSFFGKIGALLATIPLALAASVLCYIWALVAALGLSTLQYSRASSIRNIMIIGFSLFMSLSIPAYIQQYEPLTVYVLPRYLVPFAAASSGPVRTGSGTLDYIVNALLSINVIVAFMVAFILDNTVPGTREERGMYIWSEVETAENESIRLEEYAVPKRVGKFFRWAKCLRT